MTVFDIDALLADKEEREPFRFKFGGEDFFLPPTMDILSVVTMQEGDMAAGLRRLIGEKQWKRLMATEAVFDESALTVLIEAYMAHIGTTVGESSASTGSSVSTGGPSKPTSNGSTQPTLVR